MWNLSWGTMILAIVMLIIFFGLGERVLDRMGLTNSQAIVAIIGIIVGSFIDIPLWRGDIQVTLNVGGALIPLVLALYLFFKAGTGKERLRAVLAAIVTCAVTAVVGGVLMTGEVGDRFALIDPIYLYPLVAGLVAYLMGRSRRSAFIAAVVGIMGLDFVHWVWLAYNNVPGNVYLGGAGALDSIVIAGIFAVVLAEVVGEIRERLQGGPKAEGHSPELLAELRKVGPEGEDNLEFGNAKPDLSKEKAPQQELGGAMAADSAGIREKTAEKTLDLPGMNPGGNGGQELPGRKPEEGMLQSTEERTGDSMKMNKHRRPYPVAHGEYAGEFTAENGDGKNLEEFAREVPVEMIWDRMAQVNAELATETAAQKIAQEAKNKGNRPAQEKAESIARRAGQNLEELAKDGWIDEKLLKTPEGRKVEEEPCLSHVITEELALELGLDTAALKEGPRFSEDGGQAAALFPTLPLQDQLSKEIKNRKEDGKR
ncbi:MAG: DUF1614 domain-containing protein [Peptococcaceae bacterium]|nr:DUF1614 domain-containing protein [Peptococcaceae bacterium]